MGLIHGKATATIASGQTTSAAVYVGAKVPVELEMPATFTGTAISFQGSSDGVTFREIYPGGVAYSVTVAASKKVPLTAAHFAGSPYLKLVSNASEGGDRLIDIITRAGDK